MSRRGLAVLALALAALGLLARSGAVLPPGLAAPLASAGRAATPVAAGALALGTAVGAAALVRGRLGTSTVDPATSFRATRAPEDEYPLLEADVAAALDRVASDGPGADPDDRETVRAAVERAGVTVLARAEGLDEETARGRFRRGDWTRDPAVAAFCGADVEVPLRRRLEEALAPEQRFVQRTHLTVDALERVAGGPSKAGGPANTGSPGNAGSSRRGGDTTTGRPGGERV